MGGHVVEWAERLRREQRVAAAPKNARRPPPQLDKAINGRRLADAGFAEDERDASVAGCLAPPVGFLRFDRLERARQVGRTRSSVPQGSRSLQETASGYAILRPLNNVAVRKNPWRTKEIPALGKEAAPGNTTAGDA
jgi:hypothetical protein